MKKTLRILSDDTKGLSDKQLEILIEEFLFNKESVFETSNGSLAPIIFGTMLVKHKLNPSNFFIENSNKEIGCYDKKYNYLGNYCTRMTVIEDFLREKRLHLRGYY